MLLPLLLLDALLLFAGQAAGEGTVTNHVVVRLHESAHDDAPQLAVEHGFQSVRKVGGTGGRTQETKYCVQVATMVVFALFLLLLYVIQAYWTSLQREMLFFFNVFFLDNAPST